MTVPISPEAAAFLAEQPPPPDYTALDGEAGLAFLAAARAPRPRPAPIVPVPRVEDTTAGPDGPPVRLYRHDPGSPTGALLYLHGGGWVLGDLEMHDHTCRLLARDTGAAVVSVDYRLAPEHPYPVPLEDCYTALSWVAAHTAELGIDPARIGIAGSSSGGNLAAGLALLARDRGGPATTVQLLLYPVLDASLATPSFDRYGTGHFLERAQMAWFWRCYLGAAAPGPYSAPVLADPTGLPPAVVVLPELDPLRDEALNYTDMLVAAGVPATVVHVPGQLHGFLTLPERFPAATEALARTAALATPYLRPAPVAVPAG
ncbi:alpha/beta hydrolase [Pseudonocardia sp. NPDC049154]|uniref:alpha/beta hydrolase n=1 Tax=Pseudonocardia sp. NPDC049154 TaxID=3155501 RepID=UPI00340076B7